MIKTEQLSFNLDDPTEPERSALGDLWAHAFRYRHSTAYLELMKFISRFPQYSPYNCMLLHIQNPEVTCVATPNQWKKRYDREVKQNARPLLILAPKCPVLFVYDLADTEGPELPARWHAPFKVSGKINPNIWEKTIENCVRDSIFVDTSAAYSFLHAGTAFRLRSSNRILKERPEDIFDFFIEISRDQQFPDCYAVLAHELGHIYAGHLGKREDDWWKDRHNLSHAQVELEAESISYLVCRRRGVETKSAEYLSRFVESNQTIPPVSIETILSVTYHIERMGEEIMERKKKPALPQ